MKNCGKKIKYEVSDGTDPPSKPPSNLVNPSDVNFSDPTRWFEKDEFVKLSPEWKRYCVYKRYEANQKKKSENKAPHNKGKRKQGSFNKKAYKYIQEVMAKHTADLESKFNEKLATVSSVSSSVVVNIVMVLRSSHPSNLAKGEFVQLLAAIRLPLASQQR